MEQYKCGHKSKMVIADCGSLTVTAFFEWRETVGSEGTKEKCWECWCKERKKEADEMNEVRL